MPRQKPEPGSQRPAQPAPGFFSNPLLLRALIAAGITLAAFLPVLAAGFVNWDDDLNFLMNPHYRGLGPKQLAWMFSTFHMGPYQPLSWLTLGLDYTLWEMAPAGYHFTSLLLHAANAFLCVLVAFEILKRGCPGAGSLNATGTRSPSRELPAAGTRSPAGDLLTAALFSGLIFAVHPLRVESVAWITERRDVLSGFFFLLMLFAYVRAWRVAAFAFFGLSLLSKATGVTAPLVLLVLDIFPLRRLPASPGRWFEAPHRRVLIEKLPYLALALTIGVLALMGQKQAGGLKDVETFTLAGRLGLTAYASAFYLLKTAVPWNLSPLYELRDFTATSPGVLGAAAALAVITLLVVIGRRRAPALPAAWIAYLVMIAPVSGIARAGNQLAADRYTYIACLPLAFLAGVAWLKLESANRLAARVAGIVIILVLSGLTFVQTRVWHDSVSLWTHATHVDPAGERAVINLASALVEQKRYADAEALYRMKIHGDPSHEDARYSLGMVFLLSGRVTEAEQAFRDLIRDRPGFAMGHYGLGIVEMQRGQKVEARASLLEALRLSPDLVRARQALGDLGP